MINISESKRGDGATLLSVSFSDHSGLANLDSEGRSRVAKELIAAGVMLLNCQHGDVVPPTPFKSTDRGE